MNKLIEPKIKKKYINYTEKKEKKEIKKQYMNQILDKDFLKKYFEKHEKEH